MARLYAQFGAVVFLAVGLGGLLTGDAGTVVHNQPQGNFGPMALHLTYVRDILDLVIGASRSQGSEQLREWRRRSCSRSASCSCCWR